MLIADRVIALALMGLSVCFMVYAMELPIGWNGQTGGPGGGAFPFWLSATMFVCAGGVLVRSLGKSDSSRFFDSETIRSVFAVAVALVLTIAAIPYAGSYIAIAGFLIWYLAVFGGHSWKVVVPLVVCTPVFLFFFFEVTLRILLPKGWTEPWFLPLYAAFM